ncbi:YoqO family protein [Bacillus mojavensis]|uniref:YoqO family protein n=1 Tax=Bacillus mojavensis TaxID=72360 RepID=UPI002DBDA8B7|nr:YoqO family protein [Bacillus mojavensis]MEC1636744.1 YoqO family protein [Bacillus mojavensis]
MSKNLAFFLFILCVIIEKVMKNIDVISTAASFCSLVVVFIYFNDEFKKLKTKARIILFSCFFVLTGIVAFIIIEGQVFIKNHDFFNGWEFIAVIILFAVPLISGTVCFRLLYEHLKEM